MYKVAVSINFGFHAGRDQEIYVNKSRPTWFSWKIDLLVHPGSDSEEKLFVEPWTWLKIHDEHTCQSFYLFYAIAFFPKLINVINASLTRFQNSQKLNSQRKAYSRLDYLFNVMNKKNNSHLCDDITLGSF